MTILTEIIIRPIAKLWTEHKRRRVLIILSRCSDVDIDDVTEVVEDVVKHAETAAMLMDKGTSSLRIAHLKCSI